MKKLFVMFVLFTMVFGMHEASAQNGLSASAAPISMGQGGGGASAQSGLGIGVILGEPTGISAKKWVGSTRAFDAAAAWSFSHNTSFQIHADYLFHNFSILKPEGFSGRLPVYFGLGVRVKLDTDALVGIRIPFGITYLFADSPIDLFFEVVPVLDVLPDTEIDLNAAVGVRLYFK
ncbi:MAG: hypothetical protein WCU00_10125 [Candidatus Latescibacterota bacterium]